MNFSSVFSDFIEIYNQLACNWHIHLYFVCTVPAKLASTLTVCLNGFAQFHVTASSRNYPVGRQLQLPPCVLANAAISSCSRRREERMILLVHTLSVSHTIYPEVNTAFNR